MINGESNITYSDESNYEGEFEEGEYNGEGIYTFSNGDKYIGEFQNNKLWEVMERVLVIIVEVQ